MSEQKADALERLKEISKELDSWEHTVQRETFLLLNSFTDMVLVTDKTGLIKFANPSSFRILGYDPVDLLDKSVDILTFGGVDHEFKIGEYLRTQASKIIGVGRTVVARNKAGHEVPVYIYVSEFKNNGESLFIAVLHKV